MNKKTKNRAKAWIDTETHEKLYKKFMKNPKTQEAYFEEEAMYNFVEEIKKYMEKKHISYYAVAKQAGLNHQVVAKILNGSKNAEVRTLARIAFGLGGKLNLSFARR